MAGGGYELNPAQVKKALSILESIPAALQKEAALYKGARDKMLASWDSSYKQAFLAANRGDLDVEIQQLAKSISTFIQAVGDTSAKLAQLDEDAANALR